ncbi:hypothetical protein GCM10008022_27590 [Paenibacillus hunanensis]|nr:hypothetical protein GCM10008022_27590 [Paenibacillus hunanensis]
MILHVARPKHIAEILTYLLDQRRELWLKGKPQIIESGWGILEEMGYADPKPVWVTEW